jgi:hexosaminidase
MRSVYPVAPYPQNLIPKQGAFIIAADVVVLADLTNPEIKRLANDLAGKFFNIQGFKLRVQDLKDARPTQRFIVIDGYAPATLGPEGYQLSVQQERIVIRAGTPAGVFYALQTLYQLLPTELFLQRKVERSVVWNVAACEIEDRPAYSYRGLHLDVSRHFFTTDEVKRFIYLMAIHKFNHFHWHLTDDQGWRIEIKSYPKLTTVGSIRAETLIGRPGSNNKFDGQPHRGFYTQDDIRDIVRFAQEHHITIVPEIDVPGHCQAVLAAYPELGCTGQPMAVGNVWGVTNGVLCPTDETFQFLKDVFDEVADLFPGPYVHIGGDEVPAQPWLDSKLAHQKMDALGAPGDVHKLQAEFNRFLAQNLALKGKQIIGWDEILDGPLPNDAIIMSWRGTEGGLKAARMKHEAIMTPGSHCYFDHYQNDPLTAPLAIGGYTSVQKVYGFNPRLGIEPEAQSFILGGQANLWTEYIADFEHLTYMSYPRAIALSEALWTAKPMPDFAAFQKRMTIHTRRLEHMNIKFARDMFQSSLRTAPAQNNQPAYIEPEPTSLPGTIRFTTDGQDVSDKSPELSKWPITQADTLRFKRFEGQRVVSNAWQARYEPHLLAGLIPRMQPMPLNTYAHHSKLTDAVLLDYGTLGDQYVVWPDTFVSIVFDVQTISAPSATLTWVYRHEPGQGYVPPGRLTVYTSTDGMRFEQVSIYEADQKDRKNGLETIQLHVPKMARYIKIAADPLGSCPNCPKQLRWALSEIQLSAN